MRKLASISSIVLGVLMVIGGVATWVMVSTTLSEQRNVIAEDGCLAGGTVDGPVDAHCPASVIEAHALEPTGGAGRS